jgi:hypothetical protein
MHGREAVRRAAGKRLPYARQGARGVGPGVEAAEPDRVLFPALIRVALGLSERRAGHGATQADLVSELAGLLGEGGRSAPPSAEPPWPGEPLTVSETLVLRYLPTHIGAPEIAAELFLSANTVKTHLRRRNPAAARKPGPARSRTVSLAARGHQQCRRPVKHVSLDGLVLVHEREEKPPAVRQNQFLYPNGRWWHLPGHL